MRLRRRYAIALGILIAAITVSAIVSVLRNHQRAEQIHTYQAVQHKLATLELPGAIQRKPSGTCAEPVCAYTRLTPPQVVPVLTRLINVKPDKALERVPLCPTDALHGHCPTILRGRVDGYPVIGTIFWHLMIVKHGELPSGARLVRGSRLHGDLVLLGSDIEASAVSPAADGG